MAAGRPRRLDEAVNVRKRNRRFLHYAPPDFLSRPVAVMVVACSANIKWVAQVSIFRPGCSGQDHCEEKPRSQKRDLGHPLKVWSLQHFRQRNHGPLTHPR
jgi:hypothetical protein